MGEPLWSPTDGDDFWPVADEPREKPKCCLYERADKPQDDYCRRFCPGFTPGQGGAA